MTEARGNRRRKRGTVIGNKMNKTVVVRIDTVFPHPKYGKVVKRSSKVYAHDDSNALEIGTEVEIVESRPLSKIKNWRVVG